MTARLQYSSLNSLFGAASYRVSL